ncbi:MAG: hypothetical protein K2X41_08875, partial [Hyphomicrobium sp.]|nr:hypothetical protein [Hyphomicrobium sp.]
GDGFDTDAITGKQKKRMRGHGGSCEINMEDGGRGRVLPFQGQVGKRGGGATALWRRLRD